MIGAKKKNRMNFVFYVLELEEANGFEENA